MTWCLSLSLLFVPAAHAGSTTVVVNEWMADPAGTDEGGEWIELKNVSNATIDLSGWKLERAKGSWGARHTFAAGASLAPGAYLLIGESRVTGADVPLADGALDLGNAGSNADGIRIVNASGAVIDTVLYGTPNTDNLADDAANPGTSLSPKPQQGKSHQRFPDGADTDQSGTDVQIGPTGGSPKAANTSTGPTPGNCVPSTGTVVINELLPDPAGSDGDVKREWVELFNRSGTVSLEGWRIETQSTASNASAKVTFAAGTSIASGGYLLVGEQNVAGAQVPVGTFGLYAGSGGDAVRLVDCAGTLVDTVVYGGPNSDMVKDDSGDVASSYVRKPGSDESLARKRNGVDTNRSGDDFLVSASPTPGAANPEPVPCVPVDGVVINEVLPDPSGADESARGEFVELFNRSGSSVNIAGWSFVAAGKRDDLGDPTYTFPTGSVLSANGFLVVGGANVQRVDQIDDFALPNGSDGDGILLYDCDGALKDAVVYGASNGDGIPGLDGNPGIPVGDPRSDDSIARVEDGVGDDSVDDWFVDQSATPGQTNTLEDEEPEDTDDPNDTDDEGEPGGGGGGDDDEEVPGGCHSAPGVPTGAGSGLALALLGIAGLAGRARRRVTAR